MIIELAVGWLTKADISGPEYKDAYIMLDSKSPTGIKPFKPNPVVLAADETPWITFQAAPIRSIEVTEVAPLVFKTVDCYETSWRFGVPGTDWVTVSKSQFSWGPTWRANAERIHYDLDLMKHLRRADHD